MTQNKADSLLEIYLQFNWSTYISICNNLCNIDCRLLDDELSKFPKTYSYYCGLYEYAKHEVEKKVIQIEKFESSIRKKAQDELSLQGKRPTVANVDSLVLSNEGLIAEKEELEDLKYKMGLLKSLLTAMASKKDLLVQISANQRAEKQIYNN